MYLVLTYFQLEINYLMMMMMMMMVDEDDDDGLLTYSYHDTFPPW